MSKTGMPKGLHQLILTMVRSLPVCELMVIDKIFLWSYDISQTQTGAAQNFHRLSYPGDTWFLSLSNLNFNKIAGPRKVWSGGSSSCGSRGFGCGSRGITKQIWTGFLKRNTGKSNILLYNPRCKVFPPFFPEAITKCPPGCTVHSEQSFSIRARVRRSGSLSSGAYRRWMNEACHRLRSKFVLRSGIAELSGMFGHLLGMRGEALCASKPLQMIFAWDRRE